MRVELEYFPRRRLVSVKEPRGSDGYTTLNIQAENEEGERQIKEFMLNVTTRAAWEDLIDPTYVTMNSRFARDWEALVKGPRSPIVVTEKEVKWPPDTLVAGEYVRLLWAKDENCLSVDGTRLTVVTAEQEGLVSDVVCDPLDVQTWGRLSDWYLDYGAEDISVFLLEAAGRVIKCGVEVDKRRTYISE